MRLLFACGLTACAVGEPALAPPPPSYDEVAARAEACDGAARRTEGESGCVTVVVEDHLTGWWRPKSWRFLLDGEVVYERAVEARGGERFTVVIGPTPAGERVVTLETAFDPPGTGVFAEERYELRLERPVLVDVVPGAPLVVARLFERGNAAFEERFELEAYLVPRPGD